MRFRGSCPYMCYLQVKKFIYNLLFIYFFYLLMFTIQLFSVQQCELIILVLAKYQKREAEIWIRKTGDSCQFRPQVRSIDSIFLLKWLVLFVIIILKSMNCQFTDFFEQTIDSTLQKDDIPAIMRSAQKKYDIKAFKISKLSANQGKKIYRQIHNRYEKKLQQASASEWFENERRIFLWFIVLYSNLKQIQPIQHSQQIFEYLGQVFFNKSPWFLMFQCRMIIKNIQRSKWSEQQDELLKAAMKKHAQSRWNEVSKEIFYQSEQQYFKTPKQCRQRYFNHLDQTKVRKQWNKQEDQAILKYTQQFGKHWAKLIPILKNQRTEHMIKNRYFSLTRKNSKPKNHRKRRISELKYEKKLTQSVQSGQQNNQDQIMPYNQELTLKNEVKREEQSEKNQSEVYIRPGQQKQQSSQKRQCSPNASCHQRNLANTPGTQHSLPINNFWAPSFTQFMPFLNGIASPCVSFNQFAIPYNNFMDYSSFPQIKNNAICHWDLYQTQKKKHQDQNYDAKQTDF